MRRIIYSLACGALIFSSVTAHADPIEVTIDGILSTVSQNGADPNWDSSVVTGGEFTLTLNFDNSQSSLTGSGSGFSTYEPVGTLTAAFGDYSFSGAANFSPIYVDSSSTQTGFVAYAGTGLKSNGLTIALDGLFFELLSNPSQLSFSNTNLSNFQTLPISDFNSPLFEFETYNSGPSVTGSITSLSVTDEAAAPEPSTWAMLVSSIALLAFLRRRPCA